jgi:hypothetical protein
VKHLRSRLINPLTDSNFSLRSQGNMSANNCPVEMRVNCRAEARITDKASMFVLLSAIFAAIFAAIIFATRVREGLRVLELPDEVEQLVVGSMLNHGRHLYGDVFSHHGPLPYMLAQLYALLINDSDFSNIRLVQVALAMASCAALVLCPALKTIAARLWTGALYLLLLSFVWSLEGMATFSYYKMSGFLFVIVIAQCVVPSLFSEERSGSGLIVSGASGTLASFCAYSNGPAVLLFGLSSLASCVFQSKRRRIAVDAKLFALGACLAILAVGTWLCAFGDWKGFFIYHFYFNQHVYAKYIDYGLRELWNNFAFSFNPRGIIRSLAAVFFACWLYIFAVLKEKPASTRALCAWTLALGLGASGVVFTNPRGEPSIGDSGFVTANFALFAIASSLVLERNLISGSRRGILNSISMSILIMLLVSQVGEYADSFLGVPAKEASSYVGTLKPGRDPIYEFIREITSKDGDFLVLNYNASLYLKVDRLPASGNLFYLPWQAEYNRSPKYGYKMDICADIRVRQPAVIWFFNWRVWGRYSIDDYEPCVIPLIVDGYTPISFRSPWHIRNDLFKESIIKLPHNAVTEGNFLSIVKDVMRLSAQLSFVSPIGIWMSPSYEVRKKPLRRIGIMFTTYGRKNSGEAELHLKASDGSEFSRRFALSSIVDNKYQYFDIDAKWYAQGEIRSVTGEGISSWESDLNGSYTCAIYEYIDGTRGYTPACPLM